MENTLIMEWLDESSNQKKVIDFIRKQITNNVNSNDSKESYLINKHFIDGSEWLSATDIHHLLSKLGHTNIYLVPLGKALSNSNFQKKRVCGRSYYLARFKINN